MRADKFKCGCSCCLTARYEKDILKKQIFLLREDVAVLLQDRDQAKKLAATAATDSIRVVTSARKWGPVGETVYRQELFVSDMLKAELGEGSRGWRAFIFDALCYAAAEKMFRSYLSLEGEDL